MTPPKAGYDRDLVLAFIEAHMDETGQYLNDEKLAAAQHAKLDRWRIQAPKTISMSRVDTFLLRHGLMLFELEQWALEHRGDTGFRSTDLLPYY